MAESVKAQLRLLYRAGTTTFPDRAKALGDALEGIGEVHEQWYAPTIYAGSPTPLVKAREINAAVYSRLRRVVLTWQDASFALVAIANDFRDADDRAKAAAQAAGFTLDTKGVPTMPEPSTLAGLES